MRLHDMARARRWALAMCLALGWPALDARPLHDSRIPFDTAQAASSDGRVFVVSWHAAAVRHVRIFAGTDPTAIGRTRFVADGGAAGRVTIADLPAAPRWYFELVPDRGDSLVVADRSLHLSTAANFRDAGGYRSMDGEWVRMGLVYRSNGLEHLTDSEMAQIGRLNIKLVCDLRTAEERQRGPDRSPAGAADASLDVLADDADLLHAVMSGAATAASMPELEQRIYRDFVRLASAQRAYGSLFERLADPAALPTVFHCTAGKDRTGWAEAVLLTILGVPRSTIVRDYQLTNEYLRGAALESVHQSLSASAPRQVIANPAALDAAFDEVMQDYGSFDQYLSRGLRLSDATLAAIRKNFLAN